MLEKKICSRFYACSHSVHRQRGLMRRGEERKDAYVPGTTASIHPSELPFIGKCAGVLSSSPVSSTSVALHATHPWSSFFCCIRAMFMSSKNLFSPYQKNPSFQFKQKLLHKTHLTELQNQRARWGRVSRACEKAEKCPPSLWCYLPIINLPYYLPSNLHITYLLITNLLINYIIICLYLPTYLPLTKSYSLGGWQFHH